MMTGLCCGFFWMSSLFFLRWENGAMMMLESYELKDLDAVLEKRVRLPCEQRKQVPVLVQLLSEENVVRTTIRWRDACPYSCASSEAERSRQRKRAQRCRRRPCASRCCRSLFCLLFFFLLRCLKGVVSIASVFGTGQRCLMLLMLLQGEQSRAFLFYDFTSH